MPDAERTSAHLIFFDEAVLARRGLTELAEIAMRLRRRAAAPSVTLRAMHDAPECITLNRFPEVR